MPLGDPVPPIVLVIRFSALLDCFGTVYKFRILQLLPPLCHVSNCVRPIFPDLVILIIINVRSIWIGKTHYINSCIAVIQGTVQYLRFEFAPVVLVIVKAVTELAVWLFA